MSFKKTLIVLLAATFLLCAVYVAYWVDQFSRRPFQVAQSIKIYPNTHIQQLANELQQRGLWKHPYVFVLLAQWHGLSGTLHYGEYAIEPGMTARELLQHIRTARGLVKHPFRIHDGWTAVDLISALHEDSNIRFNSIAMDRIALEGLLYPDTYNFAWGVDSNSVIALARQKMQTVLDQAWASRDQTIPLTTPYEALIVASLIQTEAGVPEEQPKIAAVIYNRLKRSMRLQIDPTVMFGLGLPYGSELTKNDLEQKTAYNTYLVSGLPPTPIAFPTRTAIDAALHPAVLAALYYVAKGDGTHVFSNTYAQHQQAVLRYRAFLSEQKLQKQKLQQQQKALNTLLQLFPLDARAPLSANSDQLKAEEPRLLLLKKGMV